jgi:hypothetical protein
MSPSSAHTAGHLLSRQAVYGITASLACTTVENYRYTLFDALEHSYDSPESPPEQADEDFNALNAKHLAFTHPL